MRDSGENYTQDAWLEEIGHGVDPVTVDLWYFDTIAKSVEAGFGELVLPTPDEDPVVALADLQQVFGAMDSAHFANLIESLRAGHIRDYRQVSIGSIAVMGEDTQVGLQDLAKQIVDPQIESTSEGSIEAELVKWQTKYTEGSSRQAQVKDKINERRLELRADRTIERITELERLEKMLSGGEQTLDGEQFEEFLSMMRQEAALQTVAGRAYDMTMDSRSHAYTHEEPRLAGMHNMSAGSAAAARVMGQNRQESERRLRAIEGHVQDLENSDVSALAQRLVGLVQESESADRFAQGLAQAQQYAKALTAARKLDDDPHVRNVKIQQQFSRHYSRDILGDVVVDDTSGMTVADVRMLELLSPSSNGLAGPTFFTAALEHMRTSLWLCVADTTSYTSVGEKFLTEYEQTTAKIHQLLDKVIAHLVLPPQAVRVNAKLPAAETAKS